VVDEQLVIGLISDWKLLKEGGANRKAERWADLDDKLDLCDDYVEPPSFLEDVFDVSDETVEVPTLLCPPPPPSPPPPLEVSIEQPAVASLATTQLIECQNNTIAVLSASLQSMCIQSTVGGGIACSQTDEQDMFGRCQIYIQDLSRKLETKIKDELLEQKTEYRTHLLTFQDAFILQAEKQEKLAASLEELHEKLAATLEERRLDTTGCNSETPPGLVSKPWGGFQNGILFALPLSTRCRYKSIQLAVKVGRDMTAEYEVQTKQTRSGSVEVKANVQ